MPVNNPSLELASSMSPLPESREGKVGDMPMVPHADHSHPRITSAQWAATNAAGEATFMFTRLFDAKPSVVLAYEEKADAQPVMTKVKHFLGENGQEWSAGRYAGCVVKCYRGQPLPSSLLSLNVLLNFNPAGGTVGAGLQVSCVALERS